mgnify:FL=1
MTETYRNLLDEFISFKSISTDPQYRDEVNKTANWLHDLFKENGFESEVITG